MSDHAHKIWKGEGVILDQSSSVIIAQVPGSRAGVWAFLGGYQIEANPLGFSRQEMSIAGLT